MLDNRSKLCEAWNNVEEPMAASLKKLTKEIERDTPDQLLKKEVQEVIESIKLSLRDDGVARFRDSKGRVFKIRRADT